MRAIPVSAVRAWYALAGRGSAFEAVKDYGTLGGRAPYHKAYRILAPAFRARTSERAFMNSFAKTAYMRLDQAELVRADAAESTVFVEIERDMILENLPATVHYFGTIDLIRNGSDWSISAFDLRPEKGLISARDAAHGDASYINDVVQVAIAQYMGVRPDRVDYRAIQTPAHSRQGSVTATYATHKKHLVIELAKLYSGEYVALSVRAE